MTVEYTPVEGYPVVTNNERNRQHDAALLMNALFNKMNRRIVVERREREYLQSTLDSTRSMWTMDVTAIGAALRAIAIEREFCNEYEDAIKDIASKLNARNEFVNAAKRTEAFVVTFSVVVEALNYYQARDEIHNVLWEKYPNSNWDDIKMVSAISKAELAAKELEVVDANDPFDN